MNAREITAHRAPGVNDAIRIRASDELTVGGSPVRYYLDLVDGDTNPPAQTVIHFQNGPLPLVGPNGLTHEALLAVVADRLARFQAGPYPCKENALALVGVEDALHFLRRRTLERLARGVEGQTAR